MRITNTVLWAATCCFLPKGSSFRAFREMDIMNEAAEESASEHADKPLDVKEDFLSQPLNHFDSTGDQKVNATLMQRFFYSKRHVSNESLPTYAFLCCGGEGPSLDKSVLVDSVHCSGDMLELAKRLHGKANVHLYALEHRYYGSSYPTFYNESGHEEPALETKNLIYLSSKQAVSDLANFVATRELSPDTKWVTFGGSYPGYIAALARMLHPDLIHAAVSSSTPVHLEVDFPGYKERQAFDLQYEEVGGSPECLQIVMDGHAELVDVMIEDEDTHRIIDMFHLCPETNLTLADNVAIFLGEGVINIPAQSNDPSCTEPVCNIEKICNFLVESNKSSTALESLALLAEKQGDPYECVRVDHYGFLRYLQRTKIDNGNWRSWSWQTCTEVGYYQTCEVNSLCPYGRGYHNLTLDYEMCLFAYDLKPEEVNKNVAETSDYYGDIHTKASRILSVNGDVDPWSVLAILESNDPLMPAHIVKGASHHFWTHPVKPTDNQAIRDARDIIHLKVMEWLEQANVVERTHEFNDKLVVAVEE